MIDGKIIGIDARMIDMSGIGAYIQHLMGQGLYDVAIGNEEQIRHYDKNVKVIQFEAPIYGLKEQLMFPNRLIRDANVSIMHFPHYNVPLSYRGDYVVTIHDLTHMVFPEFLGSRIKYHYAKFLMNNAIKRAKHIFTVSEYSKKDIISYFGVSDEKVSITYDAVDEEFEKKNPIDIDYLYTKFNISREKRQMLYVGNLKPHKNLTTLLKSMQIMNRDDIELLLVGKAFKSIDLYEQEEKLGIKEKVIHTGLVSKKELIDLYNLADLFVFPSLYEGFGIPPLEAMACGTPVIAANNSSIPEVVGNAAVLFDGTNEKELSIIIDELLNDNNRCYSLIKNGKERYKLFSWEKTRNTVKDVLLEI